jgi:beta-xylosidase
VTLLHNPVIRGFAPDPSTVRVGDWYYVVSGTRTAPGDWQWSTPNGRKAPSRSG